MNIEKIHTICSEYNIENYTINDDLSIDVNGDVYLCRNNLKELPLRFRNVSGYFDCAWNGLTTLEGSLSKVGGYFHCHSNPLESLKGIPLELSEKQLYLPGNYTYSDYLTYCKVVERDFKFKKILKCQ